MPLLEPRPSWVSIVDGAVRDHAKHTKGAARGEGACLCRDIRTSLTAKLTFPHRTTFRGLVTRERLLQTRERVEYWNVPAHTELACIEVVPERFPAAAYRAVGGVIVWRHAETLQPGSVVHLDCSLLDPAWYTNPQRGLLASIHDMRVVVGVRR